MIFFLILILTWPAVALISSLSLINKQSIKLNVLVQASYKKVRRLSPQTMYKGPIPPLKITKKRETERKRARKFHNYIHT